MSATLSDTGTWFQAACSGMWYRNPLAAGSIRAVRHDGVRCDLRPEALCRAEEKIQELQDARDFVWAERKDAKFQIVELEARIRQLESQYDVLAARMG